MEEQAKTAQDYAAVRDWSGYFGAVLGKPARETLLKALQGFEAAGEAEGPRFAIDLGCGEGRDTLELLGRGWRVLAIDESQEGLDLLTGRVPADARSRVETRRAPFRGLSLPTADLVNASFCLPFCQPADFPALWGTIVAAIRPGGRFAGQFFGERDEWAAIPDRTHHTRAQVDRLFADFLLESLQEEDRDSKTATGEPKHWHVFHVVARKR